MDLTLSNINISIKHGKPIVTEDDYHPALTFKIDCRDIKFLYSRRIAKFNFFKADYNNINNELRLVDWYELLNTNDVNIAVDIFYNKINDLIQKYTPLIKTKANNYPKWFSKKIIDLIGDKNYYRKRMKKTNDEVYKILFREKRKEIKIEKKNAQGNIFQVLNQ